MVKEIFFHYSEFKGDLEALQAGDDVEFTIKDRNVGAVKLLGPPCRKFPVLLTAKCACVYRF